MLKYAQCRCHQYLCRAARPAACAARRLVTPLPGLPAKNVRNSVSTAAARVMSDGRLCRPLSDQSPHVHWVLVDGRAIILDILHNRYVSLTKEATAVWNYVTSVPTVEEMADHRQEGLEQSERYVAKQILEWQRCGLLLTRAPSSRLPTPRDLILPSSALDPKMITADAPILSSLASLCVATVRRRRARRSTLADVLCHFQEANSASSHLVGSSRLVGTVRAYRLLRAAFGAGREDCLERSLDLGLALRNNGVDARLCFGILPFPFSAHAWVQVHGVVANERLSTIQRYTHIAHF